MEVKLRRVADKIRYQVAQSDKEKRHYVVALKYQDAKTILAFIDTIFPNWDTRED